MTRFAGSIHAASSLLTLRGQLAAATDPNLWRQANLAISPRQALRDEIALSGRIYSVTSVPVGDITNSTVGALVSMVDNTESITYARRVRAIGITIGLGLALLGIVGLNAFLWYSFRPLERAIDVLQALSRGDTSVSLNYAGRDEIGRIAKALVSFRANVQELAETRRQRRARAPSPGNGDLGRAEGAADAIDPQDRDQVLSS